MRQKILLLLMAVAFGMSAIHAQTTYSATMAGPLESPPNASQGGGISQVTINPVDKTMRVRVGFAQLTGTTTACHIHAPTTTAGSGTAGVATQTPSFTGFPAGVTSGTYDHTFDMTDAASYNAAYLTANGGSTDVAFAALSMAIATGKAYINIHTTAFSSGEIRGFFQACTPTYSTNDSAVCSNAFPFTWNGVVFNGPGTQPKVFPGGNSNGCDSTAIMTVTQKDTSASYDTVAICNKYTWHDSTYKASGDYTFDTTNAVGCDSTAHLHLTILSVTSTYSKTDAGCFGSATGSITINPTYGVSPFTYRIGTAGSFVSTNTFPNLKAGKYRVTIYDANGCAGVSDQVTVLQQAAITGTFSKTDPTCYGSGNGTLTVTPTNGIAPYQYKLTPYGTYGAANSFSNLKPGIYRMYIKDGNSCEGYITGAIVQPTKVKIGYTKTDETCSGMADGTIQLSGSNGASPYTFRLGTTGAYTATSSFMNLKAGGYRGNIRDAHGCAGDWASIHILPSLDPCDPDGKAIYTAGKPAIAFTTEKKMTTYPNPSTGSFTLQLNNFKAGKAQVTVTTESGATIENRSITINSPQNNVYFNMENKAPGIYFVKVINEEGVQINKVIVRK